MEQKILGKKIEELLDKVRSYNPRAHLKFIEKAAYFSAKVHEGKKRESGDDYFEHCYEIAIILVSLKLDSHTIGGGLLHDVLEFNVAPATVMKEFDKETLDLIRAVTKITNLGQNLTLEQEKERRAENLRKIIFATSKDIRVILIKLADRLHNMITLKYLPEEKRKIISQETMDIYAPIAHKLGMYNIKAELEDLSFRFLEPKIYSELKTKISKKRDAREKEIDRIMDFVRKKLRENNIPSEVNGRVKHFFSIYKKLVRDNKTFDEIYDLIAIRIITNNVDNCYKTLGLVHKLWPHMPERLKDYIAVPKSNGYQSIHTTVIIGDGRTLEIQIRDQHMHRAAEEGIASHWRYKGDEQDKKFDRQIEWLKQFLEWKRDSADAKEFIESLKFDLWQREIFVFTPKGDIISLPEDATPVDFAYGVHTDIGNRCKSAKVNNILVPLDHKLSAGDIVEIITSKNPVPSRNWLSFVKSNHTILKIKHALGIPVEHNIKKKEVEEKNRQERLKKYGMKMREGNIIFEGKNPNLKMPKCCNPRIGDSIRAFKIKDGKIVIHKSNCINLYTYDPSREIHPEVRNIVQTHNIRIEVKDRIGLLAEILNDIARENFSVKSLTTKFGKNDRAIISMELGDGDIDSLVKKIQKVDSVINVSRF